MMVHDYRKMLTGARRGDTVKRNLEDMKAKTKLSAALAASAIGMATMGIGTAHACATSATTAATPGSIANPPTAEDSLDRAGSLMAQPCLLRPPALEARIDEVLT